MDTARIREGIRKMRFSAIWDRWESGGIGQEAAAELLGMSLRTFQRWSDRYEAEGEAGLADRRGGPSPRRAAQVELERMLGLYRDKYADFTVKHFHEQLTKRHGYKLGYTVTKVHLQRAGLVRVAPKRSAHRKKRPRRPMRGMMLHQDGSRHVWIEGLPAIDLIVTLDDATSEIYSMVVVAEEGTASTFRALREVIGEHGLFCALYTDRGSHYFHTPEAGGKVARAQLTQVGRALAHLGVEHIAAYSPQARGRSERLFATLQDRLPKELRLAGIKTVEAANAWLKSDLHRRAQRPLRRRPRTGGLGLRCRRQRDVARNPLHRRRAHRGRRQHRGLERQEPAIAGKPAAPAFRQGASARP